MPDLIVSVDPDDPTPPYEQIRAQLAAFIDAGSLVAGERLPTVRQLAGDLRVAPGTVARAYKELEAAELVATRRAAGTRVTGRAMSPAARRKRLQELVARTVESARALGCTDEQIIEAMHGAIEPAG